jgi:hypothetical protein
MRAAGVDGASCDRRLGDIGRQSSHTSKQRASSYDCSNHSKDSVKHHCESKKVSLEELKEQLSRYDC